MKSCFDAATTSKIPYIVTAASEMTGGKREREKRESRLN